MCPSEQCNATTSTQICRETRSTGDFDAGDDAEILWEIETDQPNTAARFPLGSEPAGFTPTELRPAELRDGQPIGVVVDKAERPSNGVNGFSGGAPSGHVSILKDGRRQAVELSDFERGGLATCP